MQTHANPQIAATSIDWAFRGARDQAKRLRVRIFDVLRACAEGYAAAAEYEELSKLSKEELKRRGIGRGDLPQHIFETLTRQ